MRQEEKWPYGRPLPQTSVAEYWLIALFVVLAAGATLPGIASGISLVFSRLTSVLALAP